MSTYPAIDPAVLAAAVATMVPFVAFTAIMLFLRRRPRLAAGVSLAAASVSLLCALYLLAAGTRLELPLQYAARWMAAGRIRVSFGFLLDPTSLLMLAIVAAISLLVQVYSVGYMAGDAGFSRYYAFLSLFSWAMMNLTLSAALFQLYIFWELVGLSSYLLIGFWYEKFSATQAGKKAFVMTRFGDVAFFIGLLLLLVNLGDLDVLHINGADAARLPPAVITASALLIFGGIVGKSAQFPLLTWLPDAMEGPTPVSALLHSATMVAAGVYLFARLFPFFALSSAAMDVFLAVGAISMLLAATMAMVSRDIKQVWAYSTISQLGFMIMGLAAGGYAAGVFHLTTHAGFKALLFLCSGVLIHAAGSNDVFDIAASAGRRLKIPAICITVAAAALAGLPPFSGFFSKEMILAQLAGRSSPVWLAAGLLGAFLTAYYAFRVVFIILLPGRGDESAPGVHRQGEEHLHYYGAMAAPLVILAAAALVLGALEHPMERFLLSAISAGLEGTGAGHLAVLPYLALALALAGVGLAWWEFGRRHALQRGFVERVPWMYRLFSERWYIDRCYGFLLERVVYRGISRGCAATDDHVIDGGVHGLGHATVAGSRLLSRLHTGMIQYRLIVAFAVMLLLALYAFV